MLTGRFTGKTYKEYQTKIIEQFQYGKSIDDLFGHKKDTKTSPGPNTHVLGI